MGYVPDRIPLYANASVFENLMYSAALKGILNPTSRVQSILEELHLRSIEHQPVRTLSKGWTQWVGIAQAWIAKPPLLLLDEPTSGLDPSSRKRFMAWVNNIRTEGHTVFFSSHILSEVESVCDRILWLDKGKLVNHNTPSTIQMLCSLDKLDDLQTLIETLSTIDGIQQVKTTTQGLSVQCTEPARATLAKKLIPYGLLEFRKQA
jgi:ABC-type multidrug transport system ATPase subunit